MALRIVMVAVAAAAIGVGFALPGPHHHTKRPKSQIEQIEIGRR